MSISPQVFKTEPILDYDVLCKHLMPGDLMFCSGDSFLSELIETGTKSPFSHVALLLPLPTTKDWLVLECLEETGVRCVTLKHAYLKNYCNTEKSYPGCLTFARFDEINDKKKELSHLYQTAFALTGCRYNHEEIMMIANRLLEKKLGYKKQSKIKPGKSFICSEYVAICLKSVDIFVKYDSLGFVSPGDIALSPDLNAVAWIYGDIDGNTAL
jgi:hypothetical protein